MSQIAILIHCNPKSTNILIMRYIRDRNIVTLTFDPQGHSRSNLNIAIDSPYAVSYSTSIGSNTISATVLEIFAVKDM